MSLARPYLLPPSISEVSEMVVKSGVVSLPGPGEVYLVALVRRRHGLDPDHLDPWDDRIGILRRHLPGEPPPDVELQSEVMQRSRMVVPLRSLARKRQFAGTADEGVLEWWSCRGTAEPGWAPMHRKGNIPTHRDGCARYAVPQFARNSHGGGFHHYLPDRPAFRQVGPAHIERFDDKAGVWNDAGQQIIAAHAHTISPSADWLRANANGVGDWSHACLVSLRQDDHAILLAVGGWTPEIDGCRLSLLTLPWDAPTLQGAP